MIRRAVLITLAVVAMQFDASAQTPLAPTETISVQATKSAEAKPTSFLTGGSSWLLPICPVTVGLSREQDSYVSQRVRQVAALVGAPYRFPGCNTNIEIDFTADPQAFLDAALNKNYRLLGGTLKEAQSAAKMRYPIQSWYTISDMDDQGNLLLMPPDDFMCDPYCFFKMGRETRRRLVIGTVVIVVNIDKAQGRALTSLSDYIALMALSQASAFAKCQPSPSIVNLMATDCAGGLQPDGLTAGDIAWLRDLYHMSAQSGREADEKERARLEAEAKAVTQK